mmetsp:Transcript_5479/g.12985  ORF Transcript_5479/g.12985 Transcript_5479/m.12985 type:complete len:241 (+) Transcript_5479:3019-3741(+)
MPQPCDGLRGGDACAVHQGRQGAPVPRQLLPSGSGPPRPPQRRPRQVVRMRNLPRGAAGHRLAHLHAMRPPLHDVEWRASHPRPHHQRPRCLCHRRSVQRRRLPGHGNGAGQGRCGPGAVLQAGRGPHQAAGPLRGRPPHLPRHDAAGRPTQNPRAPPAPHPVYSQEPCAQGRCGRPDGPPHPARHAARVHVGPAGRRLLPPQHLWPPRLDRQRRQLWRCRRQHCHHAPAGAPRPRPAVP